MAPPSAEGLRQAKEAEWMPWAFMDSNQPRFFALQGA